MQKLSLRIATRESQLALWQAEHVQQILSREARAGAIELVPMTTRGDQILNVSLSKIGGKGLFMKELEKAMESGAADIAVHSAKDIPMALPDGFELAAIMRRENPSDAFVSNRHANIETLPDGARVGTSSLRRRAQLQYRYPQLEFIDLRGNVNTRLAKLDAGHYDAIILASAGLIRLGLADRIRHEFDAEQLLPAVGQGALGIECPSTGREISDWIRAALNDAQTEREVTAERAMNRRLEGSCQVPIAGFCQSADGQLWLRARITAPDGSMEIEAEGTAALDAAEALGKQVAQQLIDHGAEQILDALRAETPTH